MSSSLSTFEEWTLTSPAHWQRPAFSQWWFHGRTGSYECRRSDPRPTQPPGLRSASLRQEELGHAEFPTLREGGGCRLSSKCINVRGLQADQFPDIYNDICTWSIWAQERLRGHRAHHWNMSRRMVYGVFKGDGGRSWDKEGREHGKKTKERRVTGNKKKNKEGRDRGDMEQERKQARQGKICIS